MEPIPMTVLTVTTFSIFQSELKSEFSKKKKKVLKTTQYIWDAFVE